MRRLKVAMATTRARCARNPAVPLSYVDRWQTSGLATLP